MTSTDTPDLRATLASNPDTPDAALARLCGVSRARVGQVRKAMGLPPPPRSGRGKGHQTVMRWTAEEEAALRARWGDPKGWARQLRSLTFRRHKETTMITTTHGYHIPPSNQGQTIEVGYLQVGDTLLRRTEDRSTGRVTYAVADLDPDEVLGIEPWTTEPDLPADRWRTATARDARDIEQGR